MLEFIEFEGGNFKRVFPSTRGGEPDSPRKAAGPSSQAQNLPCWGFGSKHGSFVLPLR